jgi:hypothetical protein
LLVTRGYPSLSYLYEAATALAGQDRPVIIFYFGDHDPTGIDIPRNIVEFLREWGVEVDFRRLAVTPEQVVEFGLVTRPTKTGDTRARYFEGESVEVDAIPPKELRRLIQDAIGQHVDRRILERTRRAEQGEREFLSLWADRLATEGEDNGD